MTRKRANIMLICAQPGNDRALKYDPEMCWRVRDMAQNGMFPEEWCADLGVTMSTLFQWANDHAEFDEACRIGWHLLNAYYTKKAREVIEKPSLYSDLKATVFLEILRKRFPESWGNNARNTQETFENREITTPEDQERAKSPLSDPDAIKQATMDQINARIAALEARRKAEGEGK